MDVALATWFREGKRESGITNAPMIKLSPGLSGLNGVYIQLSVLAVGSSGKSSLPDPA
jgi:hypothetical protein